MSQIDLNPENVLMSVSEKIPGAILDKLHLCMHYEELVIARRKKILKN